MNRRFLITAATGTALLALAIILVLANRHDNPLQVDVLADRVEVHKSSRLLMLFAGNSELKTYHVSLGGSPIGTKVQEGDQKTPEGRYLIDYRNRNSRFHLSLHVSYPDSIATLRANELGVSPGGMIMIHGLRNGIGWIGSLHRLFDWTDGCIAVTNPEIEEIASAVPDGTPISILP